MTDDEFAHNLVRGIANARADLILGKNLNRHLLETIELISAVNVLVDGCLANHTEGDGYMKLGYAYYRLKDEIIFAIGDSKKGLGA